MSHLRIPQFVLLVAILAGCAQIEQQPVVRTYTGPTMVPAEGPIPGVPAELSFADYWIRQAPDPDALRAPC